MTDDDVERSFASSQTEDDEALAALRKRRQEYKRSRLARMTPEERKRELERNAAQMRRWRAKNAEKWRAYVRKWNEKEGEAGRRKAAERTKAWRERQTPEERKETVAAIHAWKRRQPKHKQDAMRERERELARIRRNNNLAAAREKSRAKAKVYGPKRRARKTIASTFTRKDWATLLAKSKHCHWCKRPFSKANRPTHDHVIPLSRGGGNTLENSVCACSSCNTRKGNRLVNPVTGQGILL